MPYTRAYSFILRMYTFLPLARLFLSGATFFLSSATFFSPARLFFAGATFFSLALICRPLLDLLRAQVTNTCSCEQDGLLQE